MNTVYRMRSNYSQTKLSRFEDFIYKFAFYFRGCMWSPILYYMHTLYIYNMYKILEYQLREYRAVNAAILLWDFEVSSIR